MIGMLGYVSVFVAEQVDSKANNIDNLRIFGKDFGNSTENNKLKVI